MILTKYTTYPYTICDNFVTGDKFKEKKPSAEIKVVKYVLTLL